jgi:hypothetical protein
MLALLLLSGHPSFVMVVGIACAIAVISDAVRRRLSGTTFVSLLVAPAAAIAVAAIALLPVYRSLPLLWSYKLGQSSYEVLNLEQWLEQLRWIVRDDPFSLARVDYGTFYSHLGLGVTLLALLGLFALTRHAERPPFIALFVISLALAVPGPWLAPIRGLFPFAFTKAWYLYSLFFFSAVLCCAAGLEWLTLRLSERRRLLFLIGGALILLQPFAGRVERALAPASLKSMSMNAPALAYLTNQPELFRVSSLRGRTLLPNAAEWSHVDDLRICSPVLSHRYRAWFALADPVGFEKSFPTFFTNRDVTSPLLGAFNVRYVVQNRLPSRLTESAAVQGDLGVGGGEGRNAAGKPIDPYEPPAPIARGDLPLQFQTASLNIFRNDRAYRPRAFVTGRFTVAHSIREAMSHLATHPSLAADAPVVELAERAASQPTSDSQTAAKVTYPSESSVEIDVTSSGGGLLVLNDAFAPGWRATVDGRPCDVVPVNVIARGVFVGPGRHVVTMRYVPPGFVAGALTSLASVIALAAFLLSRRMVRTW